MSAHVSGQASLQILHLSMCTSGGLPCSTKKHLPRTTTEYGIREFVKSSFANAWNILSEAHPRHVQGRCSVDWRGFNADKCGLVRILAD